MENLFRQFFWHVFCGRLVMLGTWCGSVYFTLYALEKFGVLAWLFSLRGV